MNRQDETNPKLIKFLEMLKSVPNRDLGPAQKGRVQFLKRASEMREAVSGGWPVRRMVQNLNPRKEKFAMNILISVLLAAALLAGGGVTLASAQDDLPDEPLYEVKLLAEDIGLSLTGSPDAKIERLMELSQERMREMATLVEAGQAPPEAVLLRLEQHIQQALAAAATLEDAELSQSLAQLRDRLRTQEQLMSQLQTDTSAGTEPLLTRTRDILQTHLGQVEAGLTDPQGFRYTMQNEMQYGQDETLIPEPNQQGEPGFHQYTEPVETEVPPADTTPDVSTLEVSPGNPQNGNGNGQGDPAEQGGNGPGGGGGNH